MYVRKEALLSSQIEGTQSSLSDLMLFEHHQEPNVSLDDVEEVSNYVKALTYGLDRLKKGFPLSLRLIREMHDVLLAGIRGTTKSPGEFRRSQNWIGGAKPSNARFVPPPVDYLNQCLFDLEEFLHDETLPVLIKAGLVHVQFETIHPFLDGNGRLGRLLITLLLCSERVLDEPILYVSLHLKQHRQMYYDLLQAVRLEGAWEKWLEFFLDGVYLSAQQAIKTTRQINDLFSRDIEKIASLGRARFSCTTVFEYLKRLPQVNVSILVSELKMTAPTVRNSLNRLASVGILQEVGNKKWGKVYVYRRYLELLEEGAQPLK
jgi:Fic family protein